MAVVGSEILVGFSKTNLDFGYTDKFVVASMEFWAL